MEMNMIQLPLPLATLKVIDSEIVRWVSTIGTPTYDEIPCNGLDRWRVLRLIEDNDDYYTSPYEAYKFAATSLLTSTHCDRVGNVTRLYMDYKEEYKNLYIHLEKLTKPKPEVMSKDTLKDWLLSEPLKNKEYIKQIQEIMGDALTPETYLKECIDEKGKKWFSMTDRVHEEVINGEVAMIALHLAGYVLDVLNDDDKALLITRCKEWIKVQNKRRVENRDKFFSLRVE